MTANGWLQLLLYAACLLLVTKPLGLYLVRVYDGSMRWLRPVERVIYRACGVDPDEDQHWTRYTAALLVFSAVSLLFTYLGLRLQRVLPLNPQGFAGVPDRQAFETAVSFATNTNWQSYGGETTLSYLSQMMQLAFHNFASAAAGIAVAVALIRGIARHGREAQGRLGNFWVDLVRGTLYLLLPLSSAMALLLVQQGVIQTVTPYREVTTLEGARQVLALGPVASQVAIKQLGSNGGGYFNANSAHPFENPTPWSDFVELFAILAIASALTWTFGRMVRKQAHGWSVWTAMFLLFAGGIAATYAAEARGNPMHAARGVDVVTTAVNPGGNMEGKEVRYGIAGSALWAAATTSASNGSVNAMHDSFTPLGGMAVMLLIQLGEVAFGGVGAGLYGMLIFVVLTVFVAGLMVGRTPEYLGKKIQAREVQMTMLYVLTAAATILVFTAVSAVAPAGLAGRASVGPHGLSEILYAFSSTTGNNGSAFAGLTGTTYWYNTQFGVAMLIGRFALIVPVLALAGFLAQQNAVAESSGTFPVAGPLFTGLLVGVVLIVGALTFFPVLALGPIAEHVLLSAGRVF